MIANTIQYTLFSLKNSGVIYTNSSQFYQNQPVPNGIRKIRNRNIAIPNGIRKNQQQNKQKPIGIWKIQD